MHLTDCTDNRQGKHSHSEKKDGERVKRDIERCKLKNKKREGQREMKTKKEHLFMSYSLSICFSTTGFKITIVIVMPATRHLKFKVLKEVSS